MPNDPLSGRRVLLVGRFAAETRKETEKLIRAAGGKIAEAPHPGVDLIILGEGSLLGTDWLRLAERLDFTTRAMFERGELETISESELWRLLGIGDSPDAERPLYTGAMLAELTSVELGTIRKWQRLDLLRPERKIGQLFYFDLDALLAANRIKAFAAAGTGVEKLRQIVRKFEADHPDDAPILPRLRLAGDGKTILFPKNGELFDPQGQRFFELALAEEPADTVDTTEVETASPTAAPDLLAESLQMVSRSEPKWTLTPEEAAHFQREIGKRVVELCETAWNDAEQRRFDEAIRCCRTALCLGGFDVGVSFQLAELFVETGDLSAARERYYMVLESEEDHLEARFGLGRVLERLGDEEDAAELYRGALAIDPDYLDVRFELGALLFRGDSPHEAEEHLLYFREKAPQSTKIDEVDRMLKELRKKELKN